MLNNIGFELFATTTERVQFSVPFSFMYEANITLAKPQE
jgi:hypothetical protein